MRQLRPVGAIVKIWTLFKKKRKHASTNVKNMNYQSLYHFCNKDKSLF